MKKLKFRKLILLFFTLSSITVPIVTVVACEQSNQSKQSITSDAGTTWRNNGQQTDIHGISTSLNNISELLRQQQLQYDMQHSNDLLNKGIKDMDDYVNRIGQSIW